MAASSRIEDLAQQARFVFKGTVKQLHAATMPEVPVTDRTAVVRVDEIIHAPAMLSNYTGQDITVQLGGRKKVQVGQEAVFFTNGWLFGKSIAVQSLDHHPVERTTATLRRTVSDPVKSLAHRELQAHFESADLVVSGKVTSVRLPEEQASAAPRLRPSEHDPQWREAVVEVDDVHKGSHTPKTVVIRFPGSHDIMWHDAPKFRPGQEGHFMLHREGGAERAAESATATATGRAAAGEQFYTALHPEDFQSIEQPEGIKTLIGPSSASENH
jgi:hypothetical protein